MLSFSLLAFESKTDPYIFFNSNEAKIQCRCWKGITLDALLIFLKHLYKHFYDKITFIISCLSWRHSWNTRVILTFWAALTVPYLYVSKDSYLLTGVNFLRHWDFWMNLIILAMTLRRDTSEVRLWFGASEWEVPNEWSPVSHLKASYFVVSREDIHS